MQTVPLTLFVGLFSAILSALLTYFIRSNLERSRLEVFEEKMQAIVSSSMVKHEQIHHREEVKCIVNEAVSAHERHCPAPQKIEILFSEIKAVQNGMVFLITKQGGNPKDYNLL